MIITKIRVFLIKDKECLKFLLQDSQMPLAKDIVMFQDLQEIFSFIL